MEAVLTAQKRSSERDDHALCVSRVASEMQRDFIGALWASPVTPVATPAAEVKQQTVADVVRTLFIDRTENALTGSVKGDEALFELLRIVVLCADGNQMARVRAMAWIAEQSRAYSDAHAVAMAERGVL